MKILLFVAAIMWGSPALAETCWITGNGYKLEVYPNGRLWLEITTPDGTLIPCSTGSGGTGIPARTASCDDGYFGAYITAASTPGGENDLMIFYSTLWYRTECPDQEEQ